jgi:hypothetical protein
MKTILSSWTPDSMKRVGIFLVAIALIVWLVSWLSAPSSEIRTWYDLGAIRDNLGGSYVLMNDLDDNTPGYEKLASSTANQGKGWQPIGNTDNWFTGTFDGQGYEIRDLFINRPDEESVGLFGFVYEGVIEDIGVVEAAVTGLSGVGGLVGISDGTVSNSYCRSNVTGTMDYAGGLVGWNMGGTVNNSYSTGNVIGGYGVGGLVGRNGGTVSDSYSTGSVTSPSSSSIGGLVGINSGTVSNSYASSNVIGKSRVGGLVGINSGTVSESYSTGSVTCNYSVGGLVGRNWDIVSNSYYNYDEVLINGESIITIGALFSGDFEQWLANDKFLDVNERLSQENGYYVINNITDFKELLAFGQGNSLKFRLKNDIDLATEPNFYIPYLAGEFDGNGHKISNLSFNFGFVSHVGLFGYLALDGNLTQVAAEDVNITGYWDVGGLVGGNEGSVNDSYSTGSVTAEGYGSVGGLVGQNYEGSVNDSYSSSNVTGENGVGGLVGSNRDGTVSNCYATGSLTGDSSVGGLVGSNGGTVSNCYATGSLTGDSSVGGLVGSNWGNVSNSYATGSVTSTSDCIGGLVGINSGTVSNSYSTGSVTSPSSSKIGGLVGTNWGTVSNSYSSGSVTGNYAVGGLVGINSGTVSNSYSSGSLTGNYCVSGLLGRNWGTESSSFWDIETSGQATSIDGGTGKTTAKMQDITTFSDVEWDICAVDSGSTNSSYIWNIVDDETYPFLSWESVS